MSSLAADDAVLTRRLALGLGAGTAAWLMTGCSGGSIPFIAPADPDDEVRQAVAVSEQELLAAYDAVIAALPALGPRLKPLRAQHAEHLAAMAPTDVASASPAPGGSPSVAPNRPAALRTLRRLESRAVRQRTNAAVQAADSELVEVLARIAASEAAHVAFLGDVR